MPVETLNQAVVSRQRYFEEMGGRSNVENASRRCVARLIQRNSPSGKIQRPLLTYDSYGENIQNPAEEEYRLQLESKVASIIQEKTLHLTIEEKQYMGMVLPELVSALALDEQFISKIYERDLTSPIKIALDWFLHPEDIDQTVFRVGFGGEAVVNSRTPAYLVPSLQTIERVKTVFATHSNWALHHELHERRGGVNADRINDYVAQRIAEEINSTNGNNEDLLTQTDYLEEIQLARKLSPQHTRMILQDAWMIFLGEIPDMEELGKKYHFTNKLPKLVAFNAANAAIEIDGMDREQVITARNQTQKLLKTYMDTFHPDLSGCLKFQNDKEWNKHDPYTRLLILFLREFIDRHDGKIETIDETLTQFGQHHQRTKDKLIMGIPAPKLYAILHREFFEDPFQAEEWNEKLPKSQIMEATGFIPKHVIFHQGEPEIKFGAYRKLISEKVTASEMLRWLEQRKTLISMGYETVAEEITTFANMLFESSKGKRDYRSCLGEAFKRVCKDRVSIKTYFTSLLGSATFQEAQDQKKAWEEYTYRLKQEAALEVPEEIQLVIDQLTAHRATIQTFYDEIDRSLAHDSSRLPSLSERSEAEFVSNPQTRLEWVLTVGRIPVYYPLKDIDPIVWPAREVSSLEKYKDKLAQAEARKKRLEGTIKFAVSKVIPPALASDNNGWSVLAGGIDQFVSNAISHQTLQAWMHADALTLKGLYEQVDDLEMNGLPYDGILEALTRGVSNLVSRRAEHLMSITGLTYDQAHIFVSQIMKSSPLVTEANQRLGQDVEVDRVKATDVLWDYQLLLSDIDSDLLKAEDRYNQMLTNIF